jgi:DNA-binding transcriptional LysR family regulator
MSDIDINNIRRLDGGLLLVFRALFQFEQTTLAADRLGLSQPAVSHALARLRDIFEDPLFERLPHGLRPTRRARELAPRIEALVELTNQALQREVFDPARSTRQFRISAPEFVISIIGAPLISAIRKKAPNTVCSFLSHSPNQALDVLRRGEIDVALGRFSNVSEGLVEEAMFEDRYCVVARRGHPRLKGKLDYKTYGELPHVLAYSPAEVTISEASRDTRNMTIAAWVPGWLNALIAASKSDLIATCPTRLAERQAKALGLQIIRASFLRNPIRVSLVRRTEGDKALDWFFAELRKAVSV